MQATARPVVFYFIESGPAAAYSNLGRYMQTIAAALDSGALSWNASDDWWKENIEDLAGIHATFNPGLPFPYYVAVDATQ